MRADAYLFPDADERFHGVISSGHGFEELGQLAQGTFAVHKIVRADDAGFDQFERAADGARGVMKTGQATGGTFWPGRSWASFAPSTTQASGSTSAASRKAVSGLSRRRFFWTSRAGTTRDSAYAPLRKSRSSQRFSRPCRQ